MIGYVAVTADGAGIGGVTTVDTIGLGHHSVVAVPLGGDDLLGNQHGATDGAVFALGETVGGTSSGHGLVDNLGMTQCVGVIGNIAVTASSAGVGGETTVDAIGIGHHGGVVVGIAYGNHTRPLAKVHALQIVVEEVVVPAVGQRQGIDADSGILFDTEGQRSQQFLGAVVVHGITPVDDKVGLVRFTPRVTAAAESARGVGDKLQHVRVKKHLDLGGYDTGVILQAHGDGDFVAGLTHRIGCHDGGLGEIRLLGQGIHIPQSVADVAVGIAIGGVRVVAGRLSRHKGQRAQRHRGQQQQRAKQIT